MKRRLVTISTIAALMFAGCSIAPNDNIPPAPVVTETVTAEPIAEPVESMQDVQAWSIAANEVHSTVSGAVEGWDSSGCSATDFALDGLDPLCEARLSILETQASTAVIQWRGRLSPDSLVYIETQPESIFTFIEQGNAKVIAVDEAFSDVAETCPDGDGCAGMILKGVISLDSAETFFSNWP